MWGGKFPWLAGKRSLEMETSGADADQFPALGAERVELAVGRGAILPGGWQDLLGRRCFAPLDPFQERVHRLDDDEEDDRRNKDERDQGGQERAPAELAAVDLEGIGS